MFGPAFFAASSETPSQRFVSWWTGKQWLPQRTQIETGATDEQRYATAAFDFLDLLRRFAGPFAGGVVDVWRNEVDQVMRDAFAFVERHLGSRDLNLFVDLDRVAIDDFAIELKSDFDSERAFACGGWANNSDDWILRGHEKV